MEADKGKFSHSHLLSLEGGINRWGVKLMGANSWNQVYKIANVVLGPDAFTLGQIVGMAKAVNNTIEDLHKLVNLARTFAESRHLPDDAPGQQQVFDGGLPTTLHAVIGCWHGNGKAAR